jgi:hypothetical protein
MSYMNLMMIYILFLCLLPANAAPVRRVERTQSPVSGSVYLAFVLAALLLIIFLLAMKRGYIRRRQAQLAQTRSQFYFRQSLPGHSDAGTSCRKKAGFLVGFLGSPSLETSFLISLPQSAHSGSRRSSSIQVPVELSRLSAPQGFVAGHDPKWSMEGSKKLLSPVPNRNSTLIINFESNCTAVGLPRVPVELHLATDSNQNRSRDDALAGDQPTLGSTHQGYNEAPNLESPDNGTTSSTRTDISPSLYLSPASFSQPSSIKLVVSDVYVLNRFDWPNDRYSKQAGSSTSSTLALPGD